MKLWNNILCKHGQQKDVGEENVIEAKVQTSTKMQVEVQQTIEVQVMAKAQWRAMKMERHESKVVVKRRQSILDRTTLLEKGINIPDLKWFMCTQMKQNYDKHIERMENWKDIVEEED